MPRTRELSALSTLTGSRNLKLELETIGIIHSPFTKQEGMPLQPSGAAGVKGSVKVFEKYSQGLKDLDGFSHIILLYYFHLSGGYEPVVEPFMDSEQRGLFATRAPNRPNPIGLSIVQLTGIKNNMLEIQNVDIIDGSPLLDIKPYVPEFDVQNQVRIGWLEEVGKTVSSRKSDNRFNRKE
jgi:tRNA-Thr(GGU) m(6)t(6)A37 methyltransferase TsaA